jgi:hypothetical protein
MVVGILMGVVLLVSPLMGQEMGANPPVDKETEKELPAWMQKKLRDKDKQEKGKEKSEDLAPDAPSGLVPESLPSTTPEPEVAPEPIEEGDPTSMEGVDAEKTDEAEEEEEEEDVPSFHLGRLFSMRSVKPSASEEIFVVGMVVRMAPVQAVIKSELESLKQDYPELDEGLALLQQVDIDELEAELDALEGSAGQIPAEYLAATGLTESQQDLLGDMNREALRAVVEAVQDPEEAITFSMEPFVTFNFDLLSVSVVLPMAGFSHGGETSFDLGNITTDLRFGHHFGSGPTFGLSYGLTINAPTGTERADALALTGVLKSPRFLHAYLGLQPYLLMGLDLRYVLLQLDVGVSDLIRVRDSDGADNVFYMRYGAGLSLVPVDSTSIFAEFVGAVGIENADAYNIHLLTSGLRFHLAGIELAAAIQLPIVAPGSEAYGHNSGLAFGSPADINGLLELDVAF